MGVAFAGVVESTRPHTCNTDIIVFVRLDAAIIVFDDERDGIAVTVNATTMSAPKYQTEIHDACNQ
jgi:hypothetical protein